MTDTFVPTPRQAEFLSCPCYEVLYGGAKGGGKDLHVGERVPTPEGWKTVGDIRVGDFVFAHDGTPTRVCYISPVYENKQCFELEFSDGSKIVCSADHPWSVRDFKNRRANERLSPEFRQRRKLSRRKLGTGAKPWLAELNAKRAQVYLPPPGPETLETRAIVANLSVMVAGAPTANFSVDNQGSLELPERDLRIPPYTFGAWLGDGSSNGNVISLPLFAGGGKDEVAAEIAREGFAVERIDDESVRVHGLRAYDIGKRIPVEYLRASRRQRLALLQGLMDTDGCAEKSGWCSFSSSRRDLFDGFMELARSLGINPTFRQKEPTYVYKGERRTGKTAYEAKFLASFHVFRLPRKRDRQRLDLSARNERRFIVSAREVPSVPTKCIGIEHPSHLYIAGDQFIVTHNTEAMLRMHLPQLQAATKYYQDTGRPSLGWAVFFRKTMPQLQEVIARSHLIFPAFGARYKSDEHLWTFPCGYRFQFAHLEDPHAHIDWNGKQITLLMIDQVEEIPEEQYVFLRAQVRTGKETAHLKDLLGVRISANPLGRHVQWVKKRFIREFKDGGHVFWEKFTLKGGQEMKRARVFIKATLYDNPHINPEYEAELLDLPEHLRRAFLEGDWDVNFGSFFGDVWDRAVHVVEPFEISPHFELFRAADWGSRAPACCLWFAVDVDGDLIVFDELYGPGSTGREWAKKILAIEEQYGDRLVEKDNETGRVIRSRLMGPIDWSANAQTGYEGPTPVEQMMEMGVMWYPADKRRKEGWAEVRSRLKHRTNPKKPGIRIFSHCENLIRTLPNLIADDKEPDDIAHGTKKQEDHAGDTIRMGCMSRPVTAKDPETAKMADYERIMYERAVKKAQQALEDSRDDVTGY